MTQTRFDRIATKVQDHRVLVWVVITVVTLGALGSAIDGLQRVTDWANRVFLVSELPNAVVQNVEVSKPSKTDVPNVRRPNTPTRSTIATLDECKFIFVPPLSSFGRGSISEGAIQFDIYKQSFSAYGRGTHVIDRWSVIVLKLFDATNVYKMSVDLFPPGRTTQWNDRPVDSWFGDITLPSSTYFSLTFESVDGRSGRLSLHPLSSNEVRRLTDLQVNPMPRCDRLKSGMFWNVNHISVFPR